MNFQLSLLLLTIMRNTARFFLTTTISDNNTPVISLYPAGNIVLSSVYYRMDIRD